MEQNELTLNFMTGDVTNEKNQLVARIDDDGDLHHYGPGRPPQSLLDVKAFICDEAEIYEENLGFCPPKNGAWDWEKFVSEKNEKN